MEKLEIDNVSSDELLGYYRGKLVESEKERELFLEKMAEMEKLHDETHRLRWELRVREEEIFELQKGMSDANTYLFDEREQVLKLKAENDQLKVREIEDRARIQHLLALTQPVTQEVTFFRDCRPSKVTEFPSALKTAENAMHSSESTKSSPAKSIKQRVVQGKKPSRVLRTVFMPNEQVDELLLRCESLEAQLKETQKLADDKLRALGEDRRNRVEEERLRADNWRQKQSLLEKSLSDSQRKYDDTLRDYLSLRHNAMLAQRVLKEENEVLRTQNEELVVKLKDIRVQASNEAAAIRKQVRGESEVYVEEFRCLAESKANSLTILKEQHAEVTRQYKIRLQNLQAKLKTLSQKYRKLERRRNLELEGYTRDFNRLQKTLRALESDALKSVLGKVDLSSLKLPVPPPSSGRRRKRAAIKAPSPP